MCCCCGSRLATVIAGIYFLIEALIWVSLSTLGLEAYNCKISVKQDLPSIIYYIYFYNGQCADPPQLLEDFLYTTPYQGFNPTDITIPTVWPDVVEASQRTYQWIFAYLILSGVWAITSTILIIGSCVGCKGFHAIWYYLPWALSTLAVIVADVVASVIYVLDTSKTESFGDLLRFIGVYDPDGMIAKQATGQDGSFSQLPSLVMFVIFSRGIVLWIVNVVVFVQIFLAMLKVMKHKRKEGASQRKDSTESDEGWGWSISQSTKRSSRAGRPRSGAERRAQVDEEDAENNSDFLRILSNHSEVRSSLRENGMPPTELRSQLPWSYFSSRDEPARAPKPTNRTREPMPPVPPPDYTLRFPQAARPSLTGQAPPPQGRSNRDSLSRGDSHGQPHGRDLAGATPVFPSTIEQENSPRRVPPRVPEKPTNLRMFSGGGNSGWVRRAPEVPHGAKAPSTDYRAGPAIPEPDYSKPAAVPVIPYPDYSSPVAGGGERGAVWRQKPLHAAPHVITKTPSSQARVNENGYY